MIDYAILRDGQVAEVRSFAAALPPADIRKGADGLPLARPIEDVKPALGAGERHADAVTYEVLDDKVRRIFTAEPNRVLVSKRAIVDRLQAAGKLAAARAALDAADLYARERWNTRDSIYSDDATAIALLGAIGVDVGAILAPE